MEEVPRKFKWALLMEQGPEPGTIFPLRPGHITLGRGTKNTIVLDDAAISRQHVEIGVSPLGTVILRDLGSTNGTWIAGERVEGPVRLEDDQRFSLGETIHFRLISLLPVTTPPSPLPPQEAPLPEREAVPTTPPSETAPWIYVTLAVLTLLICLFLVLGIYLWFAPVSFLELLLRPLGIPLP